MLSTLDETGCKEDIHEKKSGKRSQVIPLVISVLDVEAGGSEVRSQPQFYIVNSKASLSYVRYVPKNLNKKKGH